MLGIRVLGVILVSAILIIPVSTARLLSRSFKALILWTVVIAEGVMIGGLLAFLLFEPAQRSRHRPDRQHGFLPGLRRQRLPASNGAEIDSPGRRARLQKFPGLHYDRVAEILEMK